LLTTKPYYKNDQKPACKRDRFDFNSITTTTLLPRGKSCKRGFEEVRRRVERKIYSDLEAKRYVVEEVLENLKVYILITSTRFFSL